MNIHLLCELLNSRESNGKHEQLRDDIFLRWSAQGRREVDGRTAKGWTDFRVKFQADISKFELAPERVLEGQGAHIP